MTGLQCFLALGSPTWESHVTPSRGGREKPVSGELCRDKRQNPGMVLGRCSISLLSLSFFSSGSTLCFWLGVLVLIETAVARGFSSGFAFALILFVDAVILGKFSNWESSVNKKTGFLPTHWTWLCSAERLPGGGPAPLKRRLKTGLLLETTRRRGWEGWTRFSREGSSWTVGRSFSAQRAKQQPGKDARLEGPDGLEGGIILSFYWESPVRVHPFRKVRRFRTEKVLGNWAKGIMRNKNEANLSSFCSSLIELIGDREGGSPGMEGGGGPGFWSGLLWHLQPVWLGASHLPRSQLSHSSSSEIHQCYYVLVVQGPTVVWELTD